MGLSMAYVGSFAGSVFRYPGVLFSPMRSSNFCVNAKNFFRKTCRGELELKQRFHHALFRSEGKEDFSGSMHHLANEEDVSRATLIWRAIKLPIYSVALVPLTVSSFKTSSAL